MHPLNKLRESGKFTAAHIAEEPTPIVLVVDDDISVRESLELVIRCEGWQPALFASAREFLSTPRAMVPSCLILDVNLSDISGLDLLKRIAASHRHMPIIFITGDGDVPTIVRAMKGGAIEFLTKPFNDNLLVKAVGKALARSRAALDHEFAIHALRISYASLTPREREVMALVVSGRLNKEVGWELGISEITVKVHRGKVMQKMNADSLADLVKIATILHPPARANGRCSFCAGLYGDGLYGAGSEQRRIQTNPN